MTLHNTVVCKGRIKARKSHLSKGSRFLESCKQAGSRGVGGEMADAMLPCSLAVASPLLRTGALWEPVWLEFEKECCLTRDGKCSYQQRSEKACIFHWGGEGI